MSPVAPFFVAKMRESMVRLATSTQPALRAALPVRTALPSFKETDPIRPSTISDDSAGVKGYASRGNEGISNEIIQLKPEAGGNLPLSRRAWDVGRLHKPEA